MKRIMQKKNSGDIKNYINKNHNYLLLGLLKIRINKKPKKWIVMMRGWT